MTEQPKISDEAVEAARKAFSRDYWLDRASDPLVAALDAAYPLLRQQWEAERAEELRARGDDFGEWVAKEFEDPLVRDAYRGAVERRLSAVIAEAIAREIEARVHVWPGMSQQAEAGNEHLRQAARIARGMGARAGRPNGTEASDA